MALKYEALNSITGLFPMANITAQAGTLPTTVTAGLVKEGLITVGTQAATKYVCIPLESIKYKGSVQNKWLLTSSGNRAGTEASPLEVPPFATDGSVNTEGGAAIQTGIAEATFETDLNSTDGKDGGFRALMRGMHESAYAYTVDSLTGNNAYTYWGESQGSYQVYNPTTLSRRYTTDLYYSLGPDQAGKDAV
tara:strand:+ start:1481 stop:2059 length:579 start_codon:yes stop_codon:yes gene_type:complete